MKCHPCSFDKRNNFGVLFHKKSFFRTYNLTIRLTKKVRKIAFVFLPNKPAECLRVEVASKLSSVITEDYPGLLLIERSVIIVRSSKVVHRTHIVCHSFSAVKFGR